MGAGDSQLVDDEVRLRNSEVGLPENQRLVARFCLFHDLNLKFLAHSIRWGHVVGRRHFPFLLPQDHEYDESKSEFLMNALQNPNPFVDLEESELQELWEKFYPRLKKIVAEHLRYIPTTLRDESYCANRAFESVMIRLNAGKHPEFNNQELLWKLLAKFAKYKAKDYAKRFGAQKRAGVTVGQADAEYANGRAGGVSVVADRRADALREVEIADLFQSLYDDLTSEKVKKIVALRMEGSTNREISVLLGTSISNVQLILRQVRKDWEQKILAEE